MNTRILLLLGLVACSGGPIDTATDTDTDTDVPALTCAEISATGTLAISVSLLTDLIPSMDEPPVGIFYGSVFAGEDVTGAGPSDTAVPIADITTGTLDLTSGGPVDAALSIPNIPACTIAILGCLDTDANDCDKHDPVTFPNNNRFQVAGGATPTPVTVYLRLLNPS